MLLEETIFKLLVNKETVFFALFLYLLWTQQQEKKEQNAFLLKQQDILADLTGSFEKLATSQEKLTQRIEKIEVIVDRREDGN